MNSFNPKEFKVTALRECPTPAEMMLCDTPEKVVQYWHLHIATSIHFSPDVETLVVFLLNTRRRVRGHEMLPSCGRRPDIPLSSGRSSGRNHPGP